MRYDKQVERKVKEVHMVASLWLKVVGSTGNQTAYSDDILDALLRKTNELEEIVNKQFQED